MSGRNILVITL